MIEFVTIVPLAGLALALGKPMTRLSMRCSGARDLAVVEPVVGDGLAQ